MGEDKGFVSEKIENGVAVVRLKNESAQNAIHLALMDQLVNTLEDLDMNGDVQCLVLTGGERVFSVGADITEMAEVTAIDMKLRNQFKQWDRIRKIRKPIIAAVNGYALGGGCELSMMCDLLIAGENAKFGQPEVKLGLMPGAGGTQWWTRIIGRRRSLEYLLTGRTMTAQEAFCMGLVNKVVADEQVLDEALKLAQVIAKRAPLSVQLIKESVNRAVDSDVQTGLEFERNAFYLLFSSEDKAEGMTAFLEKRAPVFKGN